MPNNENLSVPESCCKTMTPFCGKRDHPSNIYHLVGSFFFCESEPFLLMPSRIHENWLWKKDALYSLVALHIFIHDYSSNNLDPKNERLVSNWKKLWCCVGGEMKHWNLVSVSLKWVKFSSWRENEADLSLAPCCSLRRRAKTINLFDAKF